MVPYHTISPHQKPSLMKIANLPSFLILTIISLTRGEVTSYPGPAPIAIETDYVLTDFRGDAGKECAADDCANPDTAEDFVNEVAAKQVEETMKENEEESVVTVTEVARETAKEEETNDSSCPSRPHVIRCAAKYLDNNHNGMLEREELESIMQTVPWLLRGESRYFSLLLGLVLL